MRSVPVEFSTPYPMEKSSITLSCRMLVAACLLSIPLDALRATDTLLSYWSLNRAYIGGNDVAENYEALSTSAAEYGETYAVATQRLRANNGAGRQWLLGSVKPLFTGSEIYLSFEELDPDGPMFGDSATWLGGWTAFKNGGDDAPDGTLFSQAPGNYSLAVGQQTSSAIVNNGNALVVKLASENCGDLRLEYTVANSAVSTPATITWSYSLDGVSYTAVPDGAHIVPGGGSTRPFLPRKDVNGVDDPVDLPSALNDQAAFFLKATFSGFANNHALRIDNLKLIGTYVPPDDSCGRERPPEPNRLLSYWSFNNISDNYELFCVTADGYGEYYDATNKRLIGNSGAGSLWQTGSTPPVFVAAADVYLDVSNLLGNLFGDRSTWTSGWSAFRDGGNWVPEKTAFAPASGNFSLVLGKTASADNNGRHITFKLKSTGYGNLRLAYELANTVDTSDTVKITWTVSTDGTNFSAFPHNEQPVLVDWDGSTFPFVPSAVALPASVENQSVFYLRGTLSGMSNSHSLRFDNFQLLSANTAVVGLRPHTELFVDSTNLETNVSAFRVFHAGVKVTDPVLRADASWELNPNIAPPYSVEAAYIASVNYDATTQEFRMWYNDANSGGMLLATSSNGIVWDKPIQGIYTYNGNGTSWLTKGKGALTVYRDEAAPSAERYKALFHGNGLTGLLGAYSSNGVNWSYYNNPTGNNPPADPVGTPQFDITPLIRYGSEMAHVFRDPVTHIYRAYVRPHDPKFDTDALTPGPQPVYRAGGVLLSHDFKNWTMNRDVLQPDSVDHAMAQALTGHYGEFYSMNAFPYGRQYLGIVPLYLVTDFLADPTPCGEGAEAGNELVAPGQSAWDGPIEGQFIFSRDGYAWDRPPAVSNHRAAVIPSGAPGVDFDVSIMNVASQPVIVRRADINGSLLDDEVDDRVPQIATDEVWHYYHGISTTHGGTIPDKKIAIGVARWRLDGYASLEAGETERTVVTAPITDRTGTLEVNAAIRVGGSLWVEVLDDTNTVLIGYTMSATLTGDSIAHSVIWIGHSALPTTPYKLRFRFTEASLYSYTIKP